MPTVEEDLVDTYMNKLLAKAAPNIRPRVARSSLANITGSTPLATGISSLRAIGQGIFGAETRAQDQKVLDAKAAQLNFENQRALDKDRMNVIQRRDANIRANRIADIAQQKVDVSKQVAGTAQFRNTLLTNQMNLAAEKVKIADATQRNTANNKLAMMQEVEGLNKKRNELGTFMNQGVTEGLIKPGASGAGYILTEKGKKQAGYKEQFDNRFDVEEGIRSITERWDKQRITNAADTDTRNDFGQLNASGIASNFFAPTKRATAANADKNAKIANDLQTAIQGLTGGTAFKTNVFNQSMFDLEGSLDKPAADLLDSVKRDATDPGEINRIFDDAKKNEDFQALDEAQQKYVLAKFLKDTKGVSTSKNIGGDWYRGEWSSETVTDHLSDYIDQFNKAAEMSKQLVNWRKQAATATTANNLQLAASGRK